MKKNNSKLSQTAYTCIDLTLKDYLPFQGKNSLLLTDLEQSSIICKSFQNTNHVLWKDEHSDMKKSGVKLLCPNLSFFEQNAHNKIDRKNDFFDWIYDAYILEKCYTENR